MRRRKIRYTETPPMTDEEQMLSALLDAILGRQNEKPIEMPDGEK